MKIWRDEEKVHKCMNNEWKCIKIAIMKVSNCKPWTWNLKHMFNVFSLLFLDFHALVKECIKSNFVHLCVMQESWKPFIKINIKCNFNFQNIFVSLVIFLFWATGREKQTFIPHISVKYFCFNNWTKLHILGESIVSLFHKSVASFHSSK